MRVHAASVLPVEGLGHEGGIHPVLPGDLLDHCTVGHHGIGHVEGLLVAEVNLVLRGSDLVVGVLHGNAHRLQRKYGVAPELLGGVHRVVEIAALVQYLCAAVVPEIEVLELRA